MAAHCGGDIYSRRKILFSSFGEHTAVCGSSVRQAVALPRHRQSVCIHNIHVAATCRPSVLGSATMRGHMWLNKVVAHCAGIFIPVGNHYFQAFASTLQFVAQVCDRLWLVPATDRAFAYITYISPPHVALVCSGPPQCAATCGWTKWPVCSGPKSLVTLIECLFVCLRPCVQSKIQGLSRPVMIVSNLDTIEFIIN